MVISIMKFTSNRKAMLEAVKKAYRAIGKSLPMLGELHLHTDAGTGAVRITGTDMETAIRAAARADVQCSGAVAVDAKLLAGILGKLRGEDVGFESPDKHTVSISSGTAVFKLAVMDAANYPKPEIPIPGETVAVSGLKRLIEATSFAAETGTPGGGSRPQLRCVKLTLDGRGIRATASDGYRAVETAGDPEATGDFSVLIPAQSLRTLASISGDKDVHQFGISPTGKHAVFSDGMVLFSTRICEAEYFNTDAIFDSFTSVISAEMEAGKLKSAVSNATALADKSDILELSFRDGEIYLRCETRHGAASTSLPASVTQTDDKAQSGYVYCYSSRLLSECVKVLDGVLTLDVNNTGMLRILRGGTRYIQLPTRRRSKADKAVKKEAAATAGRDSGETADHAGTDDKEAGAA
jgi:DNA polymerase III sliding clamp (beta) subunit (PCNA family)